MAGQIIVPFHGSLSGSGELTWGQIDIWTAMQRQQSSLAFGGAFPLPPGTTVADVAEDLRFLMSRHDSLRTRLRFTGGRLPEQVVSGDGEIALEVVDPGDADPAQVAADLYLSYEARDFDYARDWPIRWAVVATGHRATHLVTAICHYAADGAGAMNMLRDLDGRVPGQAAAPVTAMQPLELARRQQDPPARRHNAAALGFWADVLRTVPPDRFARIAGPRTPRYWQARADSPAALLAAQAIAARTRASTSVVVMAAFAVLLTRLTGISPAVILAIAGNRFRPELADMVSPMCSPTPCVIDASGASFDEVVARAWRASLRAYKLAYYHPIERADLERVIGAERGQAVDLGCYFNDRRLDTTEPDEPPTGHEIWAARPRTTLTWGECRDKPHDRCFLSIDNVPGTLSYELKTDTWFISPEALEKCLRGIEGLLIAEALNARIVSS